MIESLAVGYPASKDGIFHVSKFFGLLNSEGSGLKVTVKSANWRSSVLSRTGLPLCAGSPSPFSRLLTVAGTASSGLVPLDMALIGMPSSFAIRLKCAAATMLLADPCSQMKSIVLTAGVWAYVDDIDAIAKRRSNGARFVDLSRITN